VSRRIRSDATEPVVVYTRDEFGHTLDPIWLSAGDDVPDGVTIADSHLEGEEPAVSGDGGEGGRGAGEGTPPAEPLFDPEELTVDEVNEKLEGLPADLVRAVIEAEAGGRKRHGILQGPAARALGH
jgi:hypothetical protein